MAIEVRTCVPSWATEEMSQSGPRRWFQISPGGFSGVEAFAESVCLKWDTYFGVLPRRPGGGCAKHLSLAATLWVDMDGGTDGPDVALMLLFSRLEARGLPHPSILVLSGGGIHAYWLLAQPVSVSTREEQHGFSAVLRRLVRAIGGEPDKAHACPRATDCTRILRLPGTYNLKQPGNPRLVSLISIDESPGLPLLWWKANLPALPMAPSDSSVHGGFHSNRRRSGTHKNYPWLSDRMYGRLTEAVPDGEKHHRLLQVAVYMRRHGESSDSIREVLMRKAANSGVSVDDPHQQRHIDSIVEWTVRTITPNANLP